MNAVDELNFLLGIGPPRPQLPLTVQRSGYKSVRALGKGSFGQALLVFHSERNQYYVVKHVNMANMSSRQRKDAHQEITVLQQLYHPNIVRYVEYFEEHPHLYIVMEYADGGDLSTHLQQIARLARPPVPVAGAGRSGDFARAAGNSAGLLTEPQVISLFVQTTMAVKYMHDRRLLHRDIKSQNIFLTRNHVVKLGDFGISTVLQNTMAMASTMCGTPCYFSPELCQGQPYNNKSDVWALGVLLYEMCANRLPFESTTMKALMQEIVHKQPKRIPSCFSEDLWKLVQWMLGKNPKARPDAGQILLQPVLMRHVPDIIAQLKSADFSDISPRRNARADSSGAAADAADAAGAEVLVADTEPYQQLLAQQQKVAAAGGRGTAAGDDPFRGAMRAGSSAVNDAEEAEAARLKHLRQHARPQAMARVPPSPPSAAGPAPSQENPKLTPGQRAAQAVLQQQQKQKGKEPLVEQPSAPAQSPPRPRPLPPAPSPAAPTRPIGDLLAQFEREKKRIAEAKKGAQPSAAAAARGVPEPSKPRPPPLSSELTAVLARGGAPPPPPPADATAVAAAAAAPSRSNNNNNNNNNNGGGGGEAVEASRDLGDMLDALVGHFDSFVSVKMAKAGEVIPLPAPPQAPAAPVAADGATAEEASDFADPTGAHLNVEGLQQSAALVAHPPTTPSAAAFSGSARRQRLQHGDGAPGADEHGEQPCFALSLNRTFRATNTALSNAAGGAKEVDAVAPAGESGSSPGKEDEQVNMVFSGACVCGQHRVRGALSAVYGSILCSCEACDRLVGGGGGGTDGEGVEWLHLPDVHDVSELLLDAADTAVPSHAQSPSSQSRALAAAGGETAGGAGAAAAAALRRPSAAAAPAHRFDYAGARGDADHPTSNSAPGYAKFFCGRCGCTLGLLHAGVEGLLLPPAMLDAQSHARLAEFAVPADGDGD